MAVKKRKPGIYSFQTKMILILGGLVLAVLICSGLAAKVFLRGFYEYSKVKQLGQFFVQIESVMGGLEDESDKEAASRLLESMGANNDLDIYVFDVALFFNQLQYSYLYPDAGNIPKEQRKILNDKVYEYVISESNGVDKMPDRTLMAKEEAYSIYKVFDERINSNYIEMFGRLNSGSMVYVRSNYQAMQIGMDIFLRFLVYIGLLVGVVGMISIFFVSRRFTKPILEMAEIARRMSKLDFNVKYQVTGKDEVNELGRSLNTLSEQLETTISELKSANNELQSDIQNKIQIDEMRKDFLSNVSHELKTPIALIQGYAEGLQDNINEDIESREFYCEVIIDEANKMNNMVRKLLSLNQIEFGNNTVNIEHFNLTELLTSVVNSAKILAAQKSAKLQCLQDAPLYVWSDEFFVEEVLTNYISNAINHVAGEREITVYTEQTDDDKVRVHVHNTGNQISEDELDKIWIKFYKVDKARTREYGGSGIGLSIVKAIMHSLNQECGVFNTEDGVTFWFEIEQEKILPKSPE